MAQGALGDAGGSAAIGKHRCSRVSRFVDLPCFDQCSFRVYPLQHSIGTACMVLEFLASSSGSPFKVEGLSAKLKVAEEENLTLRNEVEEQGWQEGVQV